MLLLNSPKLPPVLSSDSGRSANQSMRYIPAGNQNAIVPAIVPIEQFREEFITHTFLCISANVKGPPKDGLGNKEAVYSLKHTIKR